jgi:outer membrane protein TolC
MLALEEARLAINNFLELPRDTKMQCRIPSRIPDIEISAAKALEKVFENNPDMAALEKNLLVARRAVRSARADRFSANFRATVGLNQNQEKLADAYRSLKDQESVSFTLSIPIIDWGDTKRAITQARINRELVEESARKERDAIGLEVLNMVNEFNIKHKQVEAAAQADSIAQIAYKAVQQQFMLGKASVLEINSSYTDMQNAQNSYLNSLDNFWTQLYSIRKLCLYDFENQVDLNTYFDRMLEAY